MIIKDRKELEIKCSPVSIKEGEEITFDYMTTEEIEKLFEKK